MNRYPLWKNLSILGVILASLFLAWPNLYSQDPSIEITAARGQEMTDASVGEVRAALENAGVPFKEIQQEEGGKLLVRLKSSTDQLKGQEAIEQTLSKRYNDALTQSADLPGWMRAIGLKPMNLGLDLRGGIHVVIDVDMEAALDQALERYLGDIRTQLRDNKVRYQTVTRETGHILVKFSDAETRDLGEKALRREFPDLALQPVEDPAQFAIQASLPLKEQKQIKDFALEQNITTLRNRVNALGVAEPSIARQGERRIVVQLPGAQDPGRLKEILGATATLEYRLVDTEGSVADAVAGRVPVGSKLYSERNGKPILLKRRVIVTGDQITDASAGFDSQSGTPAVFVNLDSQGARRMRDVTTENVGKPMAVVFIENRTTTEMVNGQPVKSTRKVEEVISVANIREPFGRRFQTTGLDSSNEAHDTALLLRSGALAAPIQIVEERTIGPSLGQDNINQGLLSVLIGMGAGRALHGLLLPGLRDDRESGAGRESGDDRGGPGVAWRDSDHARHRRHGAHARHVGGRQRADLRADARRTQLRQFAPGEYRRRFRSRLFNHRRRQRHHPDRRPHAVQLRDRTRQGLRGHPDDRFDRLHVHRHHL